MNAHRRLSLVAVTATVLVVVAGLAVRASTETSPAATQPSDDFAGPMQADPGVSPADSRTANPGPGEMYLGHGIYEVVRVADADALAGANPGHVGRRAHLVALVVGLCANRVQRRPFHWREWQYRVVVSRRDSRWLRNRQCRCARRRE